MENGVNNLQVRNTNTKRIVNLLYQTGGMTKLGIANTLNLSMPTVSQILKDLHERGLVGEVGTLASSGGRKPGLNALLYNAKLSLGIEITQNHIRFVLIDLAENVLYDRRLREQFCNDEGYFIRLGKLTEQFLDENMVDKQRLLGVGVAVPGIVQTTEGLLEYVPTLGVKDLPISRLTKYIPYETRVGNEAKLAGFAEIWRMEQLSDAVFLSVNKGVGGAIIINDRVYTGLHFRSGEFGHMTIVKDGKECACGRCGCMEAYCSTRVLAPSGDLDKFFMLLQNGNAECERQWEQYLDDLATGINNLRMIFDTAVIIGGEIDRYLERYTERLLQKLRERNSFSDTTEYVHISKFGDRASAVGAALLLVDEFLNK